MTSTPPFVPVDGRLTSLQALSAPLTGGEVMEIVSPGNAQFGNNYQVTLSTLSSFFALNGLNPVVTTITADRFLFSTSAINPQTGTTYTLLETDDGGIVTLANALPITLIVPSGLSNSFSCTIIQIGVGQVTISAGAGVSVGSFANKVNIAGQYASAVLIPLGGPNFVLVGHLV